MAVDEFDELGATKSSNKMGTFVGAIVMLAMGAGVGVGGMTLLGDEESPATEEGAIEESLNLGDDEFAVEMRQSIYDLGTFDINVRGSGGGRVLRLEVSVEVVPGKHTAVDTNKALLRDGVIALTSDYTYADLEGLDGKTHLRDELLGRLNNLTAEVYIKRIFFTQFVVQ